MKIRKIEAADNKVIAAIVTEVMQEFNADPQTTVLGDPSLHTMFGNYNIDRSVYYVIEIDNKVIGGCGIKQLDGAEPDICELQRMFFLKEARGKGLGKIILSHCIHEAKSFNYKQIYIESMSNMSEAIGLYKSLGFKRIQGLLGKTGHTGCDVHMILDI